MVKTSFLMKKIMIAILPVLASALLIAVIGLVEAGTGDNPTTSPCHPVPFRTYCDEDTIPNPNP